MDTNIKIFLLCPIPEDQKPINEYINLKEGPFTYWPILTKKKYQSRILFFFLLIFFTISLFHSPIRKENIFLFDIFLENYFVATFFFAFSFLILFQRWKEIEKRFSQSNLLYEEASWYDAQIWEKPFSLLKNDYLLKTQKIKPILKRIKQTLFVLFFISLFIFLFSFLI